MTQNHTTIEGNVNPFKSRKFLIGLLVCLALPLLVNWYNLQYTRLVADDYDYAVVLEQEGLIGSVGYWYENWTGNYSSSFVQGAVMSLGVDGGRVFLLLTLPLWWGACLWLAYELSLLLQLTYPRWTAGLLGTFLLFATVDGMPNMYDTIYWMAGAIAHVLPLIGIIFLCALLLFTHRRITAKPILWSVILFSGIFTLVNAGFSTVATAFHITLLIILSLLIWRYSTHDTRQKLLPILFSTLLGCIVGLLIINAAPGGAIRQSRFPPTPDLINWIGLTVMYTLGFISASIVILQPFSLILGLLLGGLIAYYRQSRHPNFIRKYNLRLLMLVTIIGTLLIAACFSTGAYAMSTYLPARANTTPLFILTCVATIWGYLMGANLRKSTPKPLSKWVIGILVILLLLAPGAVLYDALRLTPSIQQYASEWDEIDTQIRDAQANQQTQVTIQGYSFDFGELALGNPLSEDPQAITNLNLAKYYKVDEVIAIPR